MFKNVKCVIFDFDGTIADSRKTISESFNHACFKAGLKHENSIPTESLVGLSLKEMIAAKFGLNMKRDKMIIERVNSLFREIYDANPSKGTNLFHGVKDFIYKLKYNGRKIYIATNKPHTPTQKLLKDLDINIFDGIVCINTFGNNIKKPQMIEHIVNTAKVDKHEAVMIGDTMADIHGGKHAGIRTLAVSWGHGIQSDLKKYADAYVSEIDKLHNLFF